MGKNHLLFSLTLAAAMGAGVNAEAKRVWDFTQGFSAETIEGLTNDAMGTWYNYGDGTLGNSLDYSPSTVDSLYYYREVSADSIAKVAIAETKGLLFNAPHNIHIGNELTTPSLCLTSSSAKVNVPSVRTGSVITLVTSLENTEASARAMGTTTGLVCTSGNATLVSREETETGRMDKYVVSGNADEMQTVAFSTDGGSSTVYIFSISVLDMSSIDDLTAEIDAQLVELATTITQLQEAGMAQIASDMQLVADQVSGVDRESVEALRAALESVNNAIGQSTDALEKQSLLGALVTECEGLVAERPSDALSAAIVAAKDAQANLASLSAEAVSQAYNTLRTAKNVHKVSAHKFEDFNLSPNDYFENIGYGRYALDETNKVAALGSYNGLKDVVVPETVEFEGEEYIVVAVGFSDSYSAVFEDSISSVSLPPTLMSIGRNAFQYRSVIREITVPDLVTEIGISAFEGCSALENVLLPAALDTLGENAFARCASLRSIVLPNKIKTIGEGTFIECANLREIALPAALTTIGETAFQNSGLIRVVLPDSVTSIGQSAFAGCIDLRELVLSDSLSNIGGSAFSYCTALKELTLPGKLVSVGSGAFYDVSLDKLTSLATVPPVLSSSFNDLYTVFVPDGAGDSYRTADIWKDYIIIEGEPLALDINVDVPGTLGRKVLAETENMEDVNVITLSGSLNEDDIYDIRNRLTDLIAIDMAGTDMTEMPASMFEGRSALQEIVLPAGVQSVGASAMAECRSLRTIELPATLTTIGNNAFEYCSRLEEITIPEGVTSIGSEAFSACDSLATITLPSTLTAIPSNAFSSARALRTLNLAEGLQSIGAYAFSSANKLKQVKLPATLQTIENSAFSGCTSLTEMTLPGSLTYCGNSAFPSSVKTITSLAVIPPALRNNECPISLPYDYEGYTLYVPNLSLVDYKLTEGWDDLDIKGINTLPVDINVHTDYVLNLPDTTIMTYNKDSVLVQYQPNVTLGSSRNDELAALTVNGAPTFSMELFRMTWRPENEYYSISSENDYSRLISNAPMRADSVVTTLRIYNEVWEFLSFPYDVNVADIVPADANTSWVIRKYDGAARANGESGATWVDMTVDSVLHAGIGYIWQAYTPDEIYSTFTIPAQNGVNKNLIFAHEHRSVALEEHLAEFSHNRSWNLISNPYPCFYDTRFMEFNAPITVWNSGESTYEAYSLVDDEYILRPGEAFFVQRPVDMAAIGFPTEGRQTDMTARTLSYAPKMGAMAEQTREVFNLSLTDGKRTDRTRFVINEAASTVYDMATDAGKFESTDKTVAQLYTLENGVRMAINERPMGNGRVALGLYIGNAGSYTLTLNTRSTMDVLLIDHFTGTTTDLTRGAYAFTAESGIDENRFEIRLSHKATGIDDMNDAKKSAVTTVNGTIKVDIDAAADITVYTMDGKVVATTHASSASFEVASGLYVVTVDGQSYKVNVNK